ncbi:dienelactone hydrolase family protein [Candidatus Azambacteria bacterium]|nr:dienelactone hydrolase family protein [Candidatus Azambacteria bacterium]
MTCGMIEVGAEKLPAYECRPDTPPQAAVFLTFEVSGLTDFIKDVTWRLTNENQYLALAPDWLHGLPGAAPQERVPALTDEIFAKRVETVLSFLESLGKIGFRRQRRFTGR